MNAFPNKKKMKNKKLTKTKKEQATEYMVKERINFKSTGLKFHAPLKMTGDYAHKVYGV